MEEEDGADCEAEKAEERVLLEDMRKGGRGQAENCVFNVQERQV
jgi:hypothetical protein